MGAVCNSSNKDPEAKHAIILKDEKKERQKNQKEADTIRYPEGKSLMISRKDIDEM